MHENPSQPPQLDWEMQRRNNFNLFANLLEGVASTIEVIAHCRFGERYFSSKLGIGALSILAFAFFAGEEECDPLIGLLILFFAMVVCRWIGALYRRFRGFPEHSYYCGFPIFLPTNMAEREQEFKGFMEPVLALLIGMALYDSVSEPLGLYIIFAAVCLFMLGHLKRRIQRRFYLDLEDSMLEQRHTAGVMRKISRNL